MGRLIRTRLSLALGAATLMILCSVVAPASAHADWWCWLFGDGCGGSHGDASQQTLPDRSAPEFDPGVLAGAIALAAGGAAMLSDRVRRRR